LADFGRVEGRLSTGWFDAAVREAARRAGREAEPFPAWPKGLRERFRREAVALAEKVREEAPPVDLPTVIGGQRFPWPLDLVPDFDKREVRRGDDSVSFKGREKVWKALACLAEYHPHLCDPREFARTVLGDGNEGVTTLEHVATTYASRVRRALEKLKLDVECDRLLGYRLAELTPKRAAASRRRRHKPRGHKPHAELRRKRSRRK
jgi:hypothetical protein